MSDLPYSDPSNPALPSPLFSDVTAVRGDHMRANNAAIFANLNALNARNPELVALTGGSFKTAALANANTYNGRSLFTCTAGVSDTPAAAVWRIIGFWNPTDSSGRFVAMADTSLETWEINYSGAAWGAWTRLTDSSGNLTRNVTGNVTGDVTGNADTATEADSALHAHSIIETGTGAGVMRWKIISIGDWNMDSTASVNINHGLTIGKIRTVHVLIIQDSTNYMFELTIMDAGTVAGTFSILTSYITLTRTAGGVFDSVAYDATSFNRGFITIGYID